MSNRSEVECAAREFMGDREVDCTVRATHIAIDEDFEDKTFCPRHAAAAAKKFGVGVVSLADVDQRAAFEQERMERWERSLPQAPTSRRGTPGDKA